MHQPLRMAGKSVSSAQTREISTMSGSVRRSEIIEDALVGMVRTTILSTLYIRE